jgi:hypothetical protein
MGITPLLGPIPAVISAAVICSAVEKIAAVRVMLLEFLERAGGPITDFGYRC